jgi:hypothetical protein
MVSHRELILIITSLSFVALPIALYYSWVSRNGTVFGMCLFFSILVAIAYLLILLKIIRAKRKVEEVKDSVVEVINKIESSVGNIRGRIDGILGKIGI